MVYKDRIKCPDNPGRSSMQGNYCSEESGLWQVKLVHIEGLNQKKPIGDWNKDT